MGESKDISEEIDKKIEAIQLKVLSGEISLLDLELVPIFENIKDSLNIGNIDKYSNFVDVISPNIPIMFIVLAIIYLVLVSGGAMSLSNPPD